MPVDGPRGRSLAIGQPNQGRQPWPPVRHAKTVPVHAATQSELLSSLRGCGASPGNGRAYARDRRLFWPPRRLSLRRYFAAALMVAALAGHFGGGAFFGLALAGPATTIFTRTAPSSLRCGLPGVARAAGLFHALTTNDCPTGFDTPRQ